MAQEPSPHPKAESSIVDTITIDDLGFPADCFTHFIRIPSSNLSQGIDAKQTPMMQMIPFSHRNIPISFNEFVRKIRKQEKNNQFSGQAFEH
jgi:hemerythrin superfamily protein